MVWYNAKFSQYLAFPHPLVISRASPHSRGCSVGTLQAEPGLSCTHNGETASLSFLTPLKMSFAALEVFWSGTSQSLSLTLCPGLQLPGYLLQTSQIDLGAHKGFPLRSSCSQWFRTNLLNKKTKGWQETGEKQPNLHGHNLSLGIYSYKWGKAPCSMKQKKQTSLEMISNTSIWLS